jgi:hypothetical protein
MTPLLIILSAGVIAHTVLLSLIFLEFHNRQHTANLRSSTRRDWVREEHTP